MTVAQQETVRRILIVEPPPHRIEAKLKSIPPGKVGYETTTAPLSAARELLVDHAPHLLVIDLQVGQKDALSLVRQLRADPVRSQLPVIAIGATSTDAERRRALAAGCDDLLVKPIKTQTLGSSMTKWLARSPESLRDTGVRRVKPLARERRSATNRSEDKSARPVRHADDGKHVFAIIQVSFAKGKAPPAVVNALTGEKTRDGLQRPFVRVDEGSFECLKGRPDEIAGALAEMNRVIADHWKELEFLNVTVARSRRPPESIPAVRSPRR